jgi:hypothetical protein
MAGVIGIVGAEMGIAYAQQIWAGGYGYTPPRFPTKPVLPADSIFAGHVQSRSSREERWR